jgi:hypothetical protein
MAWWWPYDWNLLPLSVCTNQEGMEVCGVIAPLILSIGIRWKWVFSFAVRPLYRLGELRGTHLTFKNCASYIQDGPTATLQMLHFIYFFHQI